MKGETRIEYFDQRSDKDGCCSFRLSWMADYHPGHPEGEYRYGMRSQDFYADPHNYGHPRPEKHWETVVVLKRTFAAAKHPKESDERASLNRSTLTSEYYRSQPWLVRRPALMSDGSSNPAQLFHDLTFRTKREADAEAARLRNKLQIYGTDR